MTEFDKIALSCALQLNLGEADQVVHRSRHQTDSAKALLAVTPALALTAFLVALLLISFIATALIRRRIPSRKYAVILSRTAADVFCSCLVAATSLYANVQSASHALLALFLFVTSFGVFHLGLSHIYVIALRYISVTRPYGFQSICSVRRISLALSIAWITSILYAAAYTPLTTVILNPARDVDVCSYETCQLPLLVVCICIMGIFIPTIFFLYLLVVYKLRQISICEKMHNEPEVTRKKFWKFVGYGGHVSLYIFIVSLLIAAAGVLLGQANTYSQIRNLMQKNCDVVEYIDTVNRLELIAGGAVLLWMVRIIFDVTILLLVERKRLMPWASNDLEPLRENTVSIRTHTLQWQKGCFNCPVFNIDAQLNPMDFKN